MVLSTSFPGGGTTSGNAAAEKFADPEANKLLTRQYRKGFEVPKSFPTKETSQASKGL